MRLNEIEARMAAIAIECETASGEALAALEREAQELSEERAAILAETETRNRLRASIAAGQTGRTIERSAHPAAAQEEFTVDSPEYRTAFLRNLRGEALSGAEQRAFTFLTTNTTAPLPTEMQNRIIDLISTAHPIVRDVMTLPSGCSISIPVAKTITTDAGTPTTEGGAANELEVAMDNVELGGIDVTANVKISYKMLNMAIDAFETYLLSLISNRLGAKLAAAIVANIKSGMATANKIVGFDYTHVAEAFGSLKRVDGVKVYGSRYGVYTKLIGMVDTTKRPIIQQPVTAGAAAVLLGAEIEFDDAIGDTELLIGDPKKYIQNVVAPITIERGKDLDNHKHVFSGYTCAEGALSDDKAFAMLSAT